MPEINPNQLNPPCRIICSYCGEELEIDTSKERAYTIDNIIVVKPCQTCIDMEVQKEKDYYD